MAITKEKKQFIVKGYVQDLQESKNLIFIRQSGLPVDTDATVRKEVKQEEGKFNVIKKRLFLRALKEVGYPDTDLDKIPGSAVAVYAKGDEYAPLKVINKYLKDFQKVKDREISFEFLGGFFDKERKSSEYVTELANIPSKQELLSKLVWLFNYPVQSLASVLDQIAKKKAEDLDVKVQDVTKDSSSLSKEIDKSTENETFDSTKS